MRRKAPGTRRAAAGCLYAGQPDTTKHRKKSARETILSTLMRRAYRRPIAKADVDEPMAFYREGRAEGDFDAGIATALSAVLTNPEFLFRVESDPKKVAASGVYRISDLELASRLSFFLWSSIPDDELLDAAIRGKLSQPGELEKQARRMLADRRSFNLATNFAGQWLRLRNIEAVTPNATLFPDFDDNLRQAFRQETELFFDSVLREDRSVLDFHQGGLHVPQRAPGEALRNSQRLRKPLPPRDARARQQARRPAAAGQRAGGHVVCDADIAGASRRVGAAQHLRRAAAASAPECAGARREHVAANLPMRQRLAAHRSNAVCASCHRTIDPVGFSLENFNAVGQWRDLEVDEQPVDASGALPGAGEFRGDRRPRRRAVEPSRAVCRQR